MTRALTALSIAPLLPDGRGGLLADLKAYSSLGLHGAGVATVVGGEDVGGASVVAQLDAVLDSTSVDVVKLTCPLDVETLEALAVALERRQLPALVVDVGAAATAAETIEAVRGRILPLAFLVVMDQTEAASLSGLAVQTWDDSRAAAASIAALGARNVVIKGGKGDASGRMTDLLYDGDDYRDYTAERVMLTGVIGAGTTFAAAIAATLAKGETVHHSVATAKAYVTKALQSTYDLGGVPSLHHFYRYWRPSGGVDGPRSS